VPLVMINGNVDPKRGLVRGPRLVDSGIAANAGRLRGDPFAMRWRSVWRIAVDLGRSRSSDNRRNHDEGRKA